MKLLRLAFSHGMDFTPTQKFTKLSIDSLLGVVNIFRIALLIESGINKYE